jgi:hypothetical protein
MVPSLRAGPAGIMLIVATPNDFFAIKLGTKISHVRIAQDRLHAAAKG